MHDDRQLRFLELHLKSQRALFGYLLAAVHDYQEAEDLLQEITIVLWKKFPLYQESMPYAAWAYGVARLELARRFRDTHRHKEALALLVLDSVADSLGRDQERLQQESRVLAGCVRKLAPDEQELVNLRYEQGTSLHEVARRLGKTAAAINMKLVRIRRALLECTAKTLTGEA